MLQYNSIEKHLFNHIVPVLVVGDFLLHLFYKYYTIKPDALRLLLVIYARLTLFNKPHVRFIDLTFEGQVYDRRRYLTNIKGLTGLNLVYHVGLLGCYSITDEGKAMVKEYYRLMKGYTKLYYEQFEIKDELVDPSLESLL